MSIISHHHHNKRLLDEPSVDLAPVSKRPRLDPTDPLAPLYAVIDYLRLKELMCLEMCSKSFYERVKERWKTLDQKLNGLENNRDTNAKIFQWNLKCSAQFKTEIVKNPSKWNFFLTHVCRGTTVSVINHSSAITYPSTNLSPFIIKAQPNPWRYCEKQARSVKPICQRFPLFAKFIDACLALLNDSLSSAGQDLLLKNFTKKVIKKANHYQDGAIVLFALYRCMLISKNSTSCWLNDHWPAIEDNLHHSLSKGAYWIKDLIFKIPSMPLPTKFHLALFLADKGIYSPLEALSAELPNLNWEQVCAQHPHYLSLPPVLAIRARQMRSATTYLSSSSTSVSTSYSVPIQQLSLQQQLQQHFQQQLKLQQLLQPQPKPTAFPQQIGQPAQLQLLQPQAKPTSLNTNIDFSKSGFSFSMQLPGPANNMSSQLPVRDRKKFLDMYQQAIRQYGPETRASLFEEAADEYFQAAKEAAAPSESFAHYQQALAYYQDAIAKYGTRTSLNLRNQAAIAESKLAELTQIIENMSDLSVSSSNSSNKGSQ